MSALHLKSDIAGFMSARPNQLGSLLIRVAAVGCCHSTASHANAPFEFLFVLGWHSWVSRVQFQLLRCPADHSSLTQIKSRSAQGISIEWP
jgi:hypothetical protein